MKITRRSLAAVLAAPAAAQTVPAGSEEELEAARKSVRRNIEALEKVELPVEVEPAFQFRA